MNGDATSLALQTAVACALLMLGRRLYWVFVAGVGFAIALSFVAEQLDPADDWMPLLIAIAAGIVGALLALFLQRLAIGLAGFFGAAYATRLLIEASGLENEWQFVAIIAGGVIGALIAGTLFDWALIVLSSLTGAALLVDTFNVEQRVAFVLMVIVTIAGMSIQSNMLHRDRALQRGGKTLR